MAMFPAMAMTMAMAMAMTMAMAMIMIIVLTVRDRHCESVGEDVFQEESRERRGSPQNSSIFAFHFCSLFASCLFFPRPSPSPGHIHHRIIQGPRWLPCHVVPRPPILFKWANEQKKASNHQGAPIPTLARWRVRRKSSCHSPPRPRNFDAAISAPHVDARLRSEMISPDLPLPLT